MKNTSFKICIKFFSFSLGIYEEASYHIVLIGNFCLLEAYNCYRDRIVISIHWLPAIYNFTHLHQSSSDGQDFNANSGFSININRQFDFDQTATDVNYVNV